MLTRILLLCSLFALTGMTSTLFTIANYSFSLRDVILIVGGLFLLVKGTQEIHNGIMQPSEDEMLGNVGGQKAKFWLVIVQIMILDIVFSLDSVITAVGMTRHLGVMISAIVIAMLAMLFASEPLNKLINQYASLKMLALSFLLLVGFVLIADGFGQHISRGYVYFAMMFSLTVEALSIFAARKRRRKISDKA